MPVPETVLPTSTQARQTAQGIISRSGGWQFARLNTDRLGKTRTNSFLYGISIVDTPIS